MAKKFKGVVNIDVRDSVPDWTPFREPPAPEGAPNVLLVLYDDTGMAAWSPYGGRINMPTMQKLADNGLTYTQWHTTALCSPTRSCLLTGRNHHQNGFAQIAEGAQGFPGHTGHIPMENATIGEVLRENGYNTFWVGKNHNVPLDEWAVGATKRNWPLARGLRPLLRLHRRRDQQLVPDAGRGQPLRRPALPPRGRLPPVQGPGRQGDLASSPTARPRRRRSPGTCGSARAPTTPRTTRRRSTSPSTPDSSTTATRPTASGCCRGWSSAASCPRGPALTDINPLPGRGRPAARPRAAVGELNDEEKRLFAQFAEVYAGFSEYTDAQVGRIIDYLEETGQLENTIIMYCRRQRRLGRGQPRRHGEREQVLQRLSRGPRGEPVDARRARIARHLQPLPDRAGPPRSPLRSRCSSATPTRAASRTRW